MRLLIQSAMIFFGTLLAAGLLALGEPQPAPSSAVQSDAERGVLLVLQGTWAQPAAEPSAR